MAVVVRNLTVSLDGYAAARNQRADQPFGDGGDALHEWMSATRTFGGPDGSTGIDDLLVAHGADGVGAVIMGRNMFGPQRGPWADASWTGWWGPNPPFHTDVFVRTHHLRPAVTMEGGTTFRFTSDPAEQVLDDARAAAGDRDVQIAGGAATVREYLAAELVDDLHLVIAPVLLGSGERVLGDLAGLPAVYRVTESVSTGRVTHVRVTRR